MLATTLPSPPVAVTVSDVSSLMVVLPFAPLGRITVPKAMSWVLVSVVGETTVTLETAEACSEPAASAPVATVESASAAADANRMLRKAIDTPE